MLPAVGAQSLPTSRPEGRSRESNFGSWRVFFLGLDELHCFLWLNHRHKAPRRLGIPTRREDFNKRFLARSWRPKISITVPGTVAFLTYCEVG